ncbi:HNH endonuclease, partial [Pseudomonas coronafaciens]
FIRPLQPRVAGLEVLRMRQRQVKNSLFANFSSALDNIEKAFGLSIANPTRVDQVYRGHVVSDASHPETTEATELVEQTSSSPDSHGDEEGEWQQLTVTRHERSRANRKACLDHYGPSCQACGMSFGDVYGELGTDFIHVHHEVPLHTLGGPQNVDPVNDMKPLCPNCHAMVHRADPPIPVMELREQLVLNG